MTKLFEILKRRSTGPEWKEVAAATGRRPRLARPELRYEAAEKSRRTDDWIHPTISPAELITGYQTLLVQRSRDLARTNPLVTAAFDVLGDNTAGTVLFIESLVRGLDGELDRETSEAIEDHWLAVEPNELDLQRRESWRAMRALLFREYLETGEFFALDTTDTRDRSRMTPYVVEPIPAERIDWTLSEPRSGRRNRITNGIEFDLRGRRVAYHLSRLNDDGEIDDMAPRIRLPADRIEHRFRRTRVGQERGIPPLFVASMLARDVDTLIDTELTSAQVAACLTAFISREGGGIPELTAPSGQERDVEDDRPVYRFQPGAVWDLGPGEKVEAINPQRPAAAFDPAVQRLGRIFFKALGLSYEAGAGDYSQTNYSSGRLGSLADRKVFRRFQSMIEQTDRRVWRNVIRWGATTGALPITLAEYLADPTRFTRADVTHEGQEHHDPVKEANAAALRVAFGLSTKKAEAAALGRSAAQVLDTRIREMADAELAGVPELFPSSVKTVEDQAAPAQADGEEPPVEEEEEEEEMPFFARS